MPAPENHAVLVRRSHYGVAGMERVGSAQDDVVLGVGGRCEHAAGSHLGIVVPGLPEHFRFCGLCQELHGVVALDRLELVASRFGDDVAVGVALGVQVLDVVAERVVVPLQAVGDVTDVHQAPAGDYHGFAVLEDLGVVAVFLEFDGESGGKACAVRHVEEDPRAVNGAFHLGQGVPLVLGEKLFLVGQFHLKEAKAQRLFLGRGQEITFVVTLYRHRQHAADALELERVPVVAGGHEFGVGGGELAVEEAVLQVVGHGGGIGCVQGAAAVLAPVRIQVLHREGGRFAVGRDVTGTQGDGDLVLGIFAVHHDLVAGHPGGLEGRGSIFALLQDKLGEDEGEGAGLGLHHIRFGNRGGLHARVAGRSGECQDAKDRYFVDCLHNPIHLRSSSRPSP